MSTLFSRTLFFSLHAGYFGVFLSSANIIKVVFFQNIFELTSQYQIVMFQMRYDFSTGLVLV